MGRQEKFYIRRGLNDQYSNMNVFKVVEEDPEKKGTTKQARLRSRTGCITCK
jgi:hypothetical protein